MNRIYFIMDCFALGRKHRFIGVFDTGAGGLNVLKECRRQLMGESYLYFADNLNAPYGNYDENKIRELTLAAAARMDKYGLKALLLACNTATSAAVNELRKIYHYPVIGMEPAIKPAALAAPGKDILILCTPATARQEKLKELMKVFPNNKLIIAPQKNLASEIENNLGDAYPATSCHPFVPKGSFGAVVLGCTHYIFIKDIISEKFDGIPVFDGVNGTVNNLMKQLKDADLLSNNKGKGQLLITTTAPTKFSYWKLL